jgi:acetyltransferase-like isoleucine patch superfamily enzyme
MKFNNRNIHISPTAKIGSNVKIGDNTVIYDNVEIGDNTVICNDCIIGEPLGDYYKNEGYENPATKIGANGLIRSHAIIYASNEIGDHFISGHHIMLRAGNKIGHHSSVGNFTELHGDANIGNYVRLHSNVCICEYAIVHDYVWIFPGSILSNGVTPPGNILIGPEIGSYSVLAVNAVVLPGVKIGEHCLIGAATVVTKDVADYQVAVGSPAKIKGDVRNLKSKATGEAHYPWPERFDRGMPWQGEDYNEWLNKQNKEK